MKIRQPIALAILASSLILTACGGDDDDNEPTSGSSMTPTPTPTPSAAPDETPEPDAQVPTTYTFDSELVAGESAVSYSGQTMRHVLIMKLNQEIGELEEDATADPEVLKEEIFNFYFRFNTATSGAEAHEIQVDDVDVAPGLTYADISSSQKDLVGKIAGNDNEAHILDGEFFGWETGLDMDPTPEELVDYFFDELATEATNGTTHFGSTKAYLSATGLDYKQLIQKFLLGSLGFSQGAADYLQSDWNAKLEQDDDAPYTSAEHLWDEAFGYFGAARDFGTAYTDDELAAGDRFDTNNDGRIDLYSEWSFGNSVNCAKRDRGATVATDFTKEAFDAFLAGRAMLNAASADTSVALTDAQLTELAGYVTTAAVTWEKCVAATVVHYINDTIADMGNFQSGEFADASNFEDLAKHWGEMKGFALGLQFSPESPFRASDETLMDLKDVLSLMGDAPVLADGTQAGEAFEGGVAGYIEDLLEASDIMERIYDFDSENVANW